MLPASGSVKNTHLCEFCSQGQTVNQHYNMKSRIQGIAFSAMTIHLLTVLSVCWNFWLKTK
jgi:hypothetical protein